MSKSAVKEQKKISYKFNIPNFINSIKNKVLSNQKNEKDELLNMLKEAHTEWRDAEKFFDNATEPDLIDYAIYKIDACKTKYSYLIKKAREDNIKIDL